MNCTQASSKNNSPYPKWNYSDESTWAKVSSLCFEGQQQSPINIETSQLTLLSENNLNIQYDQTTITNFKNVGFSVHANIQLGYTINAQDKRFHTDGEHTIDGNIYPLEVHFVHSDTNNNLSVIGVLFQEGTHNKTLQDLLPHQIVPKMLIGL